MYLEKEGCEISHFREMFPAQYCMPTSLYWADLLLHPRTPSLSSPLGHSKRRAIKKLKFLADILTDCGGGGRPGSTPFPNKKKCWATAIISTISISFLKGSPPPIVFVRISDILLFCFESFSRYLNLWQNISCANFTRKSCIIEKYILLIPPPKKKKKNIKIPKRNGSYNIMKRTPFKKKNLICIAIDKSGFLRFTFFFFFFFLV